MKLRKTGLLLLAALVIMVLCTVGFASAEGPTNPYRESVIRAEQTLSRRLAGPHRGDLSNDTDVLSLSVATAPALDGTGIWDINFACPDGETVQKQVVALFSKDYSDDFTTVYWKEEKNNFSTQVSLKIVTEGEYVLQVEVYFTDGTGYFDNLTFTIADDGAHTSLTEQVAAIVATESVAGNAWQTALNLHDWLTTHAYYDNGLNYYGADGVLLRGYGVCDSYSKAYLLLCQAADIPVSRVTGLAQGGEKPESHAWNAIQIGDEWYYVDVTWDDPSGATVPVSGQERYEYFCLNDALMSLDHTKDTTGEGAFSESCTSLDANWALRMSPDTWSSWETWNELGNNTFDKSFRYYSEEIRAKLAEETDPFAVQCGDTYYIITSVTQTDSGTHYGYSYHPANSGAAIRGWTLLSMVLNRTFSDQNVSVTYDRANNQFVVDPDSQGNTETGNWSYEYEEGEQMLRITGTGAVKVNGTAPWLGQNYDIKRVMVESGITSIGPDVFAGLDDGVRIDFCQDVIPSIDLGAFGGTEAVCRYISDNGSWKNNHPEIDGVSWVWMPTFNTMAAGTFGPLWYMKDSEVNGDEEDYEGWSVRVNAENKTYPLPVATAHEILRYCYDLFLNDIPDPEELSAVIGDTEGEDWYLGLTYKCKGTLKLNGADGISVTQMPREINISSPDLVMEVTDPRDEGIHKLEVQSGTITYNGNVQQLILTNSCEEKGNATVNGTIEELDFYNGDDIENRPFYGTLTVTGSVLKGIVYGDSDLTMDVPGISEEYPLGSGFAGTTFEALTDLENEVVIDTDGDSVITDKAVLNETAAPTVDQFTPRYVFAEENNWLDLRPKEGSGLGSEAIEININQYNPDFLDNPTDNIIWGDDTAIYLSRSGNGGPIVLAGKAGEGFGVLEAGGGCDVKVTCPLGRIQLQPDPEDFGTINMVFENTISGAYLQPNNCKLNVTLQNGGSIAEGRWKQLLRDYRNFGAHGTTAGESMKLVDNSTLTVMSWTYSELFSSIMPSDEAVGQAAGVDHAMATLTESDLTLAEMSALQNVVYGEGESLSVAANQIISVFDVSVKAYTVDDNGTAEVGADIHTLNDTIPITISNSSEETDVFVVRLHDDGENIEAARLEVTDVNGGKQFESNLFSTYLLVSANALPDNPIGNSPKISGESVSKAGDDYLFTVSNLSHEGGYFVSVSDRKPDETSGDQTQIFTKTGDLTGDDSLDFTIPAVNLIGGHSYSIYAEILDDDGYYAGSDVFAFYVYDPSAETKITLSTEKNTVKTAEDIEIHAQVPDGTTAIRFWNGDDWNLNAYEESDGEWIFTVSYDDPGTAIVIAEATEDPDRWNAPESAWIYTSNPLMLTVTQEDEEIYGFSVTPEVLPDAFRGDMLKLTVTAENSVDFEEIGGNAISAGITDGTGSSGYYYFTEYRNEEFPFTFSIPTHNLSVSDTPTDYMIVIRACGVGYQWKEFRIPFRLKDAAAIVFYANNGMGEMSSQSVEKGVSTALFENPFIREGWHFLGWTTDPEENEPDYTDGEEVCITEDLELYALWEPNTNSFSLDVVDLTDPEAPVSGQGGTIQGTYTLNAGNEGYETRTINCSEMTDYDGSGCTEVWVEAHADPGYSFVGWYSGEEPEDGSQKLVPGELLSSASYYSFEVAGDNEAVKICAAFREGEAIVTASPYITGEAFAVAGRNYTFTISNLATWDDFELNVYDQTEPDFDEDYMPKPVWTTEGDLSGEDSRIFSIPKDKLKVNHQYAISAYVGGQFSYNACHYSFRVVSSAKPTVTLEPDRDEAGILETVMLTVTPPKGSTAVQLWTDGYIYNKVAVKNGKAELTWLTEYPGEYRMFALATTDKRGINAPESSWTAYSNVLTVTVTQSDEDLCGFTFTPPENLDAVPRGQVLEVTVDAESPSDWNRLKMIIFDEYESVYGSADAADVEFPYVLQLPATMKYKEGREYRLMVQACGVGSCWVTEYYPFTFMDGSMILFHPNDGTRKEFSQPLPQPEEPEAQVQVQLASKPFTASGRHIIGWATENTDGNWDPENLVYADGAEATVTSGDLDLYAIWETNNSYLSVDAVDMTYPEAAVNLVEGGTVNVTIWREENNWAPDLYEDVRSTNFLMCGINEVRLHAEPDEDYEFVGWYSGENPVINSQALLPVEPLELLSTETNYFFESSGDEEWKKVCAVFVRSENFGTAAFTVPSALNKIEENAFEGISAKSVYVPDTCTEIGSGAFSNCENLLKIRLPKDCDIDEDAFAGSGRVVIYAPAGGETQRWAEAEENGIAFREEK